MLDTDTKRRIDTARDILVGKVPDPKSQVEQITIALIYKFMDDMDAEAAELGGQRKFFAGEFARYGWAKLMRSGLGGHETLNVYAEAISKMPENPGIPLLFRNIFKNAYLPYRDPETLRAFLKIIDEFTYDHSGLAPLWWTLQSAPEEGWQWRNHRSRSDTRRSFGGKWWSSCVPGESLWHWRRNLDAQYGRSANG